MNLARCLLIGLALFLGNSHLFAQDVAELLRRIESLEARLDRLERENVRLKTGLAQRAWQTAPTTNHLPTSQRPLPGAQPGLAFNQKTKCANHLKNIGLALRIFAVDHRDTFPFHLPTAEGGSKESVSLDPEGYDQNSFRHLATISNELVAPQLLVCPADPQRKPAADFSSLESSNVTYILRTGPEVTERNPRVVLASCPIHHHRVHMDGTMSESATAHPNQNALDSEAMELKALSARNACIHNLRLIDGAKEQWALERRKVKGTPVIEDGPDGVTAYLKGAIRPVCPSGGTYTYGPVAASPKCTTPGHQLP